MNEVNCSKSFIFFEVSNVINYRESVSKCTKRRSLAFNLAYVIFLFVCFFCIEFCCFLVLILLVKSSCQIPILLYNSGRFWMVSDNPWDGGWPNRVNVCLMLI